MIARIIHSSENPRSESVTMCPIRAKALAHDADTNRRVAEAELSFAGREPCRAEKLRCWQTGMNRLLPGKQGCKNARLRDARPLTDLLSALMSDCTDFSVVVACNSINEHITSNKGQKGRGSVESCPGPRPRAWLVSYPSAPPTHPLSSSLRDPVYSFPDLAQPLSWPTPCPRRDP